MLRRKQFVKKTKRGSVVTINREHYLRKDIWCGYEKCNVCKHTNPPLEEADIIVPDTNVVLHQIDGIGLIMSRAHCTCTTHLVADGNSIC